MEDDLVQKWLILFHWKTFFHSFKIDFKKKSKDKHKKR